jgi:hypothetical protein
MQKPSLGCITRARILRNREEGRSRDMYYLTGNKHCIKLQLYSVKPVTLLGALVLRGTEAS